MDQFLLVDRKKYPVATHYNVTNEMPPAKPKNAKKLYETKRNTFIDDIIHPKRDNALPVVGKYNITITLE